MIDIKETIKKFPKNPTKRILFYTYNKDLVENVKNKIIEIFGESYLKNVVIDIKSNNKKMYNEDFIVYYDPNLQEYIGNGQN